MTDFPTISLAIALGSCVTWFITSRFYLRRLLDVEAERKRESQNFERELAARDERDRHEAQERRRLHDLIRSISSDANSKRK